MPADNIEAGRVIDDFQIIRRLGEGGMAVVYLARQISLDRLVALKVLGPALTRPSDLTRFRREAQAVAKLHHPGIAGVHRAEQDGKLCYMAMDYIDGITLRDLIDLASRTPDHKRRIADFVLARVDGQLRARPTRFDVATSSGAAGSQTAGGVAEESGDDEFGWSTREALELIRGREYIDQVSTIVRDTALALAHAHEHDVIHRDIKPNNLMLDRDGRLYVIDFGVARFFEDVEVTHTGQIVGTPMYMSPEQVTGRRIAIDHRTDIYSLGLVLYELLTLSRPLIGGTREAILKAILTNPLFPVTWRNPSVPRDLESIVHKATEKNPDDRYQSAAEFAADLQNFLEGKPVAAPTYHFRFDEREITAERPSVMSATAFWFHYLAIFYGMVYLPYQIGIAVANPAGAPVFPDTRVEYVLFIGGYASFAAATCWVGFGLFFGRPWTRWLGIPLALIAIGLSLPELVQVIGDVWRFSNLEYLALMSIWVLCRLVVVIGGCFAIFALLLHGPSKQWFHFSQELRSERLEFATALQTGRWPLPRAVSKGTQREASRRPHH